MKKFLQKKLKEQKGMTLIELLAVIVIIAIIAAIAIPAIGNVIDNSRVGAMKSDASNALQAAELYLADNPGHFTASVTTLTDTTLVPGYMKKSSAFSAFTIEQGTNGLIFTGTGTKNGVTLAITDAANNEINSYANNSRAETATAAGGTIKASK